MSTYNPNIPISTDLLSDSQQDLFNNMQQLDASFLIDHYTFSDLTINNGKHRQVSTPVQAPAPATTTDPKLYGFQPSANIGVIQYSRAPNNRVQSPVTMIQSPAAAIVVPSLGVTPILDCTGLARCYGTVMANDANFNTIFLFGAFWWRGAAPPQTQAFTTGLLTFTVAGNIINIRNGSGGNANLFWTIQLYRTE